MRNSEVTLLMLFLLAVVLLSACGGGETETAIPAETDTVDVVQQEEIPEEDFTTMQSWDEKRNQVLRTLAETGTIPPKPIGISGERYVDQLVQRQIRRAYGAEGEYIDPMRVRELLHKEMTSGELLNGESADAEEQDVDRTWRISYDVHRSATEKFKQGEYMAAAREWQSLPTLARTFTLSVEIDCIPDKLTRSYSLLEGLEMPIFILPQLVRGKQCFRLCAGIFDSQEEAEEYLETITEALPGTYPFAMSIIKK